MMVGMALFWIAMVALIVWAAGGLRSSSGRQETPLDILERRFAEGAISADDYRRRRQALGNQGGRR
jgi:putative membrane protein